jgi:hypothetical protein
MDGIMEKLPFHDKPYRTYIYFGAAALFMGMMIGCCFFCCCKRSKKKSKKQAQLNEPLLNSAPEARLEMQEFSNPAQSNPEKRAIQDDNGHTSGLLLPASAKPPAMPTKREPALLKPSTTARTGNSSKLNIIELLPDGAVTYDLDEIKVATKTFNRDFQIGVGACGPVFKALLRVGATKDAPKYSVAVKCLMSKDPFEGKQFDKEIEILTKYRHETLLPLIGVCDGPPRCIVTELMTNGSLYHRLQYTRVQDMAPMTWKQRVGVAVDTATALDYLHNKSASPLIHRDVKSLNILLDEDYNGRLCDFGVVKDTPELAGGGDGHTHVNTVHVSGTMAYMPRECKS